MNFRVCYIINWKVSLLIIPCTGHQTCGLIFISYSSKQAESALKLKCYIDSHFGPRVETWLAMSDMVGGPLEAMSDNVKRASMVILCLSSSYEKSEYCLAEACMAMEQKKNRLVLIMEDGYDPKNSSTLFPIVAQPRRIKCYNDKMLQESLELIYREIEISMDLRYCIPFTFADDLI